MIIIDWLQLPTTIATYDLIITHPKTNLAKFT